MAFPDFIIIGAMKCGTSTLASQLGAQEGVFLSTPKEPNFFSDDDIYARGPGWYQGLFDDAPAGALLGEASTHYTKLPTYPKTLERLSETLDAPKLVYVIRDPVARAVSHYIHEWTQGVISSGIERALQDYPELVDYGCYAMQLKPWLECFGRDRVFLTSMEAMQRDPQVLLDRVGVFLRKNNLEWKAELGPQNVSADRIRRFPLHDVLIDNPAAAWLRRLLVPQSLRDKIKKSRQMKNRPKFSKETETRLRQRFAKDRDELFELFPENADIRLSYSRWAPDA